MEADSLIPSGTVLLAGALRSKLRRRGPLKSFASIALFCLCACAASNAVEVPSLSERLASLRPKVRAAPADALPELDALAVEAPRDPWVLCVRAECLVLLGEWERVLADLDAALALDPSIPWAHYERGVALGIVRGAAPSIEAFTRAIELDPRHYKAFAHRGDAHAQLSRYDEAEADFARSIECWPAGQDGAELARVHAFRANALSNLGRDEEAQQALARCAELRRTAGGS